MNKERVLSLKDRAAKVIFGSLNGEEAEEYNTIHADFMLLTAMRGTIQTVVTSSERVRNLLYLEGFVVDFRQEASKGYLISL